MLIGMLNEKKRKYLLLLLSIVIIVVYSAIYWNRVIPFTDGWGIYYAELMKTGKYPYRDFYVYLPPLNLTFLSTHPSSNQLTSFKNILSE